MPSVSKDRQHALMVSDELIPSDRIKTGRWRFLTPIRREKASPCQERCPLENAIPHWMNKIREGDWEAAWSIIEQYNPFPAITGYVCYQFCQEGCNRGLLDEALHIREVEKAVGLWRHKNFKKSPIDNNSDKRKTVAIVGSGPTGLTSAYYLNKLGMSTVIFEKRPVVGGLLATGIPEYRLPPFVLDKELEMLKSKGIIIKTGLEIGKNVELTEILTTFDAVVIALGAQKSKQLTDVPGMSLPGVADAIEFLESSLLGKEQKVKGSIVVIGGGNVAVNVATVAHLHGAAKVTLLYRRSREEMPAHADEINAAQEAGVEFIFESDIVSVLGEGKVEGVRAVRTVPSRRGQIIEALPGTEFDLRCDLLVVAAGQESTVQQVIYPDIKLSKMNGIIIGKDELTGRESIVVAGDAVTGPTTVPKAIFRGRQAALAVCDLLSIPEGLRDGGIIAPPLNSSKLTVKSLNLAYLSFHIPQQVALEPEIEASRCLSCGVCNHCGVCWVYCPDMAIAVHPDGYEILPDYCKGCGICATECPTGTLEMKEG